MRKRRNSGGGGWTRTNGLRPGKALLSRTEKSRDRRSQSDMRKRRNSVGGGWTRTNDLRQGKLCCPVQKKAETVAPRATCEKDEILLAAVGLEPTTYARESSAVPYRKKPRPSLPQRHAKKTKYWWRRLDSNQRPTDYETV